MQFSIRRLLLDIPYIAFTAYLQVPSPMIHKYSVIRKGISALLIVKNQRFIVKYDDTKIMCTDIRATTTNQNLKKKKIDGTVHTADLFSFNTVKMTTLRHKQQPYLDADAMVSICIA
jgi:hypothetical protein